jgi:pentatricopeptide repeat protein
MPDESTYIILIEGLAYEGFSDEAKELLESLCSRGVVNKNLIEE